MADREDRAEVWASISRDCIFGRKADLVFGDFAVGRRRGQRTKNRRTKEPNWEGDSRWGAYSEANGRALADRAISVASISTGDTPGPPGSGSSDSVTTPGELTRTSDGQSSQSVGMVAGGARGAGRSAAISTPGNRYAYYCRLTQHQIWHPQFPETFGINEATSALEQLPDPYRVSEVPREALW